MNTSCFTSMVLYFFRSLMTYAILKMYLYFLKQHTCILLPIRNEREREREMEGEMEGDHDFSGKMRK